jgi:hypothetical protein
MNPRGGKTHWNDHSADDGQVAILGRIALLEILVRDEDELVYGMQDPAHKSDWLLDDHDACFLDGIACNG